MADLFSLQRIAAENGWSMAALGIIIDLTGLAVLSLIVSRVPKFVGFIEKTSALLKKESEKKPTKKHGEAPAHDFLSERDVHKTARIYREYTAGLEEPFQLSALYRACEKKGLPHPHLTIKALREENLLVSEGNGLFRWNV